MFDNTAGTFDWTVWYPGEGNPENTLNITWGVDQVGSIHLQGLTQKHRRPTSVEGFDRRLIGAFFGGNHVYIARELIPITLLDGNAEPEPFRFLDLLGRGDLIGPDLDWRPDGHYWAQSSVDAHALTGRHYVGVRLGNGFQTRYGWIDVEFRLVDGIPEAIPLRWAYETEPNTPLRAPAPGVAATLAAVLARAGTRRRRS